MTTSATGGFLAPEASPVVLGDVALQDVLQATLVGVTGLAGGLVRPGWQPNPPARPAIGVNWVGFSVLSSLPDGDVDLEQIAAPTIADPNATAQRMKRGETLEIIVSCYGPNCSGIVGVISDGLWIEQNRAALVAAGLNLVGVGSPVHAPEPENDRWHDRWDVTFQLRREIVRVYPVLHLVRAQGEIVANRADEVVTRPFDTGV